MQIYERYWVHQCSLMCFWWLREDWGDHCSFLRVGLLCASLCGERLSCASASSGSRGSKSKWPTCSDGLKMPIWKAIVPSYISMEASRWGGSSFYVSIDLVQQEYSWILSPWPNPRSQYVAVHCLHTLENDIESKWVSPRFLQNAYHSESFGQVATLNIVCSIVVVVAVGHGHGVLDVVASMSMSGISTLAGASGKGECQRV